MTSAFLLHPLSTYSVLSASGTLSEPHSPAWRTWLQNHSYGQRSGPGLPFGLLGIPLALFQLQAPIDLPVLQSPFREREAEPNSNPSLSAAVTLTSSSLPGTEGG